MFRYMFLLSRTIYKKWSFYIVLLVTMLLFSVIVSLMISNSEYTHTTALSGIDSMTTSFLFICSTLFTLLMTVHIFKQGELDGSELMIVAKPITRKEILGGKFLMLLSMLILFQILMVIDFAILANLDSNATQSEKTNWILSLMIGGLIIQLIVAAIVVLFASILGKVGTIIVTLFIAAFLSIITMVFQMLGYQQPSSGLFGVGDKTFVNPAFAINGANNDNYFLDEDQLTSAILSDQNAFENYKQGIISNAKVSEYPELNKYTIVTKKSYDNYIEKSWYLQAAYVDFWYQWSRFYNIFTENKPLIPMIAVPEKYNKLMWNQIPSENKFKINNTEYITFSELETYQYNDINPEQEALTNQLELELNAKYYSYQLINEISSKTAFKTSFLSSSNFFEQLRYIEYYIEKEIESTTYGDIDNITIYKSDMQKLIKIYAELEREWSSSSSNVTTTIPSYVKINSGSSTAVQSMDELGIYNQNTISNNNNISVITYTSPIISTGVVIAIWVVVGLLLLGGAILIYAYRDFK